MAIYKAPENINNRDRNMPSVFLAGSIDMDKAINWQVDCENRLGEKFNVFNPRRKSWDSSWKQELGDNDFTKQVNWELNAMEESDHIILFFASESLSPISLLEFGLYADSGKLNVVCEDGFWRKGNVDVVCDRYKVIQFENLEKAMDQLIINT